MCSQFSWKNMQIKSSKSQTSCNHELELIFFCIKPVQFCVETIQLNSIPVIKFFMPLFVNQQSKIVSVRSSFIIKGLLLTFYKVKPVPLKTFMFLQQNVFAHQHAILPHTSLTKSYTIVTLPSFKTTKVGFACDTSHT